MLRQRCFIGWCLFDSFSCEFARYDGLNILILQVLNPLVNILLVAILPPTLILVELAAADLLISPTILSSATILRCLIVLRARIASVDVL